MPVARSGAVPALVFACCLIIQQQAFSAQPAHLDTDEAGIWMVVEKHEQELRTSNKIIQDDALSDHLKRLTCQTVGDQCNSLRYYAIRAPGFNAFMMPNGAMFVQSGLLLRIDDDAELAAVLGHEVSHFARRHSVESFRRWSKASSAMTFLSALVSAAGQVAISTASTVQGANNAVSISNTAALMVSAAGIFASYQLVAYDRNQEREADMDGIKWMHQRGMDVTGPARLWQKVIQEQEAGGDHSGFSLLATHPAPRERMAYLSSLSRSMQAEAVDGAPPATASNATSGIRPLINPYREDWIVDELAVQHPGQFAAIAESQAAMGLPQGLSQYLKANAYAKSQRGDDMVDALKQAVAAFELADSQNQEMPAEAYREWAKVSVQQGDTRAALSNFRRYLKIAPNAWDAKFIRRELDRL